MKLTNLWTLFFLISFVNCAGFRSGKYVYFEPGMDLNDLARVFGVTTEEIKIANQKISVKPGAWIFIPSGIGILPQVFEGSEKFEYSGNGDDGKFAWPVPSRSAISSDFGLRNGKSHDGIDIPAPTGTQIVASETGRVIYSGKGISGYGNLTIIGHKNRFFTVYAHADKNLTRKGQMVKRGQVIAYVGNTGRSSGPHLHFEIRKKSSPQNPMAFIAKPKASKSRALANN